MSVLGYAEAYEGSVRFDVRGGRQIHVASLAGVVLKVIAWSERQGDRRQDPIDLCTIMKHYDEVVALDLYDQHHQLTENLRRGGVKGTGRPSRHQFESAARPEAE